MKSTLSLLLLLIAFTAFSQIPKPIKNTYVNDFAGVLSKTDIQNINVSIKQIEDVYGVQLALVIVNKIPKEYDIESYSLLIARKWKVGKKDDGLVYVAALNQRKQRLEVARNLDTIFNEQRSAEVLATTKVHFRAKNYEEGLTALVTDIALKLAHAGYGQTPAVKSLIAENNAVDQKKPKTIADETPMSTTMKVILGIIVGFVMLFFYKVFSSGGRRSGNYNNYNGYNGNYRNGGGGGNLGSFAAGAATGFFANSFFNRNNRNHQGQFQNDRQNFNNNSQQSNDSGSTFGNWGSSNDNGNNDGSNSGGSSSSSNSGFSGGGASSDW